MKKILYIITKSNWGGAQRYVYDLATHLPHDQFEVVVAFGQPGLLARRLQEAGIATRPIASLQRDVSLWADIKSFFELYWLMLDSGPDVVHLNSSKAGGMGAAAAWLAGIQRIVFTVHGWPFLEARAGITRAFIWLASWLTALLSHKVICISDFDAQQARAMPFVARKVVRLYNGIGPLALGSGDSIRSAFPAGAKIMGTIGELNKNKNQQALIEQARKNPQMHVAIVGEGELRHELESKIKEYKLEERVRLFGFMPAAEAFRGFDVFALPSLKEGLPYVLLEARAAGLPIEASRVGGVGEILDAQDMSEFSLDAMVQRTAALY
ncbi:MAG TPA: glycosyltransferase [Candidatus Paceibacterota bacterium]